jgi:hypothetical protein
MGFEDLEDSPRDPASPGLEGPTVAAGVGAVWGQAAPYSGHQPSSPAENILWPE